MSCCRVFRFVLTHSSLSHPCLSDRRHRGSPSRGCRTGGPRVRRGAVAAGGAISDRPLEPERLSPSGGFLLCLISRTGFYRGLCPLPSAFCWRSRRMRSRKGIAFGSGGTSSGDPVSPAGAKARKDSHFLVVSSQQKTPQCLSRRSACPVARMTSAITSPPPQPARQFQRFFEGVTPKLGVWSSWKGQRPMRLSPWQRRTCRQPGPQRVVWPTKPAGTPSSPCLRARASAISLLPAPRNWPAPWPSSPDRPPRRRSSWSATRGPARRGWC